MFILHILCATDITAAYNLNAHLKWDIDILHINVIKKMITLAHFQKNK